LKKSHSDFIPAQESAWFIAIFDWYVRFLFRRRFHRVWFQQNYFPSSGSKTIYFLNHTSWWDGLIPLLLNRKIFKQKARAMMEDRQMKQHSFFKKIGAFSVSLENPRSAIKSMRYAVNSLDRPNSSLFIYPEGEIMPFTTDQIEFKKGLAWIADKRHDTEVVPIGIYFHFAKSDKPELFIKIGEAIKYNDSDDTEELNSLFERRLSGLLGDLKKESHSGDQSYQRLL
jgi:chlorobactene lauroyltransferase